jgi:lipopolysaccharide/colanic/teichoic acid biosynthesis glycosyltransferase
MDKLITQSTPAFIVSPKTVFSQASVFVGRVTKRGMDIFTAFVSLVLLSPLFVLVALLIKRDSPGPVFYHGRRVGRNGREFAILKFRTMKECPESYQGPRVTAQDDPRVTRFGRRLRKTKINELPQLWNVLKGEMSLVGPRPEDPEIVAAWTEQARREVLSIRPGITSPASVVYRDEELLLSNGNLMQTYLQSVLPSKLRLDQLYVRHRSFWLDLDILFWTFLVLLPLLGSFVPAEEALFQGPLARMGRRYINWFAIDTVVTLFAIGTAGIIWRLSAPLDIGVPVAVGIALGFSLLFSLSCSFLGMDRIAWSQALASDAVGLVFSAGLATGVALAANELWGRTLLPRGMIIAAALLALAGFITVRYRGRLVRGLAYRWLARTWSAVNARDRVLIVGGGTAGQFVAWLLGHGSGAGVFHVVGFVDDDLYKQGIQYLGIRVLGRRIDIRRLVEQEDVGIIVFAIHNIDPVERSELLAICESTAARVLVVPDIVGALNNIVLERANGKGPRVSAPESASEVPLYTSQGIPPAQAELWLSNLEEAAKAGDLASLGEQIRSIREGIQKFGV